MSTQVFVQILHEVGPRWVMLGAVGYWFWRCTPWFGSQAEKLVDAMVERLKE